MCGVGKLGHEQSCEWRVGGGGGGDFAGLNGDRSGYSFNAENVSNFMWLLGFGNGYYRRTPAGGGGGGHSQHDWLRRPFKKKHIARVCRGSTHPKFWKVCNITTGEGELVRDTGIRHPSPNLNPVPSFSCHDDVKLIWNFDSKILDISCMK